MARTEELRNPPPPKSAALSLPSLASGTGLGSFSHVIDMPGDVGDGKTRLKPQTPPEASGLQEFLGAFRGQFPEYDDLSDAQLLGKLRTKFYPDMSEDVFRAKLAVKGAAAVTTLANSVATGPGPAATASGPAITGDLPPDSATLAAYQRLNAGGGSAVGDVAHMAASEIPFADRAAGALAAIVPGGANYAEGRAAFNQRTADLNAIEPTSAKLAAKAIGIIPVAGTLGATGLGPIATNAALGGLSAAAQSRGSLKRRAAETAAGAGAGALLGKGADLLLAGGAPVVGAVAGGAVGAAATPGGLRQRAEVGLLGGAGGYLLGTAAGSAANRLIDVGAKVLGREAPSSRAARAAAIQKLLKAIERDKITPEMIQERAASSVPGMTIMDVGRPSGNVTGLARAAESVPSEGSREIGNFLASRSQLNASRAERAVRRAMGNRFGLPQPIVKQAKEAVQAKTAPLYAALADQNVSAGPLLRLLRDEPAAREIWSEVQTLAAKQVRDNVPNARILPNIFRVDPNGKFIPTAEEVPVQGLDLLKRGLRAVKERKINSSNPITTEDAKLLSRRLSAIVEQAKQESSAYEAALAGYAKAAEEQVQGMSRQKETLDFIRGGSPTARIQQGQIDLKGEPSHGRYYPSLPGMAERLLSSRAAMNARGFTEDVVNQLAPMLTRPLTAETPMKLELMRAQMLRRLFSHGARAGMLAAPLSTAVGGISSGNLAH